MTLFLCPFPPTGCSGRGWGAPDLHIPGRACGWRKAAAVAWGGCGEPCSPSKGGLAGLGQLGLGRGWGTVTETPQQPQPSPARGALVWGRGAAVPSLWRHVAMGNKEWQGCVPRPAAPLAQLPRRWHVPEWRC